MRQGPAFSRRCRVERLAAADRRNLPIAELGRRLGLGVAEIHQLKAAGVTNFSSLASAILAAGQLERLADARPFVRDRGVHEALASRALPAPLVEAVVRSIGESLDAAMQKKDGARPRPQHEHRRERPQKKKPGGR